MHTRDLAVRTPGKRHRELGTNCSRARDLLQRRTCETSRCSEEFHEPESAAKEGAGNSHKPDEEGDVPDDNTTTQLNRHPQR